MNKKNYFSLIILLFAASFFSNAQDDPRLARHVHELQKAISPEKLSESQQEQYKKLVYSFEQKRIALSPRMSQQDTKALIELQELKDQHALALKKLLTEEQYKNYTAHKEKQQAETRERVAKIKLDLFKKNISPALSEQQEKEMIDFFKNQQKRQAELREKYRKKPYTESYHTWTLSLDTTYLQILTPEQYRNYQPTFQAELKKTRESLKNMEARMKAEE